MALHELAADGIGLRFDEDCGMLRGLTVTEAGREMRPMHRVQWAGEAIPEGSLPHLATMEGDFFCAPFADGGGTAPLLHGHPANGRWRVAARKADGALLTAVLMERVQGAVLTKTLRLRDGHPFLYQSHLFEGGGGTISAANHAMVSLPNGGLLNFSPKAWFRTPEGAPEPDAARGRSSLAYPAWARDPAAFPGRAGPVDLTRYPFRAGHEEFVAAVEAAGRDFGWTAVVRLGFGELYLSLRDPQRLPMTMLWHSDGGRDYAPWSGRHRACLGIEEGWAPHMLGEAGGLALGGRLDIRHAIGVIAWPGEARVAAVEPRGGALVVTGEDGTRREVPFDLDHLYG